MRVFVAVDVADFLHGAGHLVIPTEVIKKHKAGIKIYPFQNIIGDGNLEQGKHAFIILKLII